MGEVFQLVESLQFLVLLTMLLVRALKPEVVNRLWRKPSSNCLYPLTGSVLDLCRSKSVKGGSALGLPAFDIGGEL